MTTKNYKFDPLVPFSVEQFPILTTGMTDRKYLAFSEAVSTINQGIAENSILNPRFLEIKEFINRRVDEAYKSHISVPFTYSGNWEKLDKLSMELEESFSVYGLHDCKSATKRVRASKASSTLVDALNAFFNEMEPLNAAFDYLKPLIKKRIILTAEEQADQRKFVPPPVGAGAKRQVYESLLLITEQNFLALVSRFELNYVRNVEAYVNANAEDRKKIIRDPNLRAGVFESVNTNGDGSISYIEGYKTLLRAKSIADAKFLQEQFISKNFNKLGSIVDAKGNLNAITVDSHSVSLAGLTGTLAVSFKDESSFKAQNSVVMSYSVYGKPFCRFPLTFHDVKMPDGSLMPRPSEERVNEIFCGKSEDEKSILKQKPRI